MFSFAVRTADVDEPLAALAFKVATDPYVGRLVFLRVYSGTVKSGASVINITKGHRERMGRLLLMHANRREELEEVTAGHICAAVGLKNTFTGDTICGLSQQVILEPPKFPEHRLNGPFGEMIESLGWLGHFAGHQAANIGPP